MDRRDDWREWERCACDETQAAQRLGDGVQARNDAAVSDARPSGDRGRIMVIGFSVIRV